MPRQRQKRLVKQIVFSEDEAQPSSTSKIIDLKKGQEILEKGATDTTEPTEAGNAVCTVTAQVTAGLHDQVSNPVVKPPFIPDCWQSSKHPSERPPTPVKAIHTHTQPAPRMTSHVVDSVLSKCKRIDEGAQLASATFTQDGETLVRVRTSIMCSITSLRQAIENVMPLCGTEVVDNPLDGTTEIGVIVPTKELELKAARNLVRKRIVPRMIGHVGFLLFLFGLAAWIVELVESTGKSDAREL